MNIVVCVKQVPAPTEVKIDPKTNTLIREGIPGKLNLFDKHAVEEALRTKEKYGGHVIALSMGPLQAEEVLVDCLAMGVDEAVLLTDIPFMGSDTLATSYALSLAIIKQTGFDVIFCGQETTDSSTGQVGPEIAEHLNIPQITFVRKIEKIAKNKIIVRRETDEGYQVIGSPLPALLTVTPQINESREPSLRKINKSIKRISVVDFNYDPTRIGMDGSPTQVVKVSQSKAKSNVFFVPSHLSARQRIELIMSGGVPEKKDNLILQEANEGNIRKLVKFVRETISNDGTL